LKINKNLLKILESKAKIKKFLEDTGDIEFSLKRLSVEDLTRISVEYPSLLDLNTVNSLKEKRKKKTEEEEISIICLTIIKRDKSSNNYMKLKKIKIYLDEKDEKILKVLQN
jgi:hypothetical protein